MTKPAAPTPGAVAAPRAVDQSGEPTDRMVAAVLPAGERAWFFKVVGPAAAVEKHDAALEGFLKSLRLADDGQPKWDLPAGWQEVQGSGMRAATIHIPTGAEPLELSVIGLPWQGTPDELLSNVNRWRGQMRLPEAAPSQLTEFTREQKVGDATMTIVDLQGSFGGGPSMNAPFAGAAPAGAPAAQASPSKPADRMVAAVLPVDDRVWFFKVVGPVAALDKQEEAVSKFLESIRIAEGGRPTWKLPAEDWKERPGSGMRAATVVIPAEGDAMELSVIALPWRGTPGELLSNINRWRGQMKLPEASADELGKFTRERQVGDTTMTIVDLRGNFDAGPAMVPPFARGAGGGASQPPGLPPGHPPLEETNRDKGADDGDR